MTVAHLSILLVLVGNLIRLFVVKHDLTHKRALATPAKPPVTWQWLWVNRREKMVLRLLISLTAGFLIYTARKDGLIPYDSLFYLLEVAAGYLSDKLVDVGISFISKHYGVPAERPLMTTDDHGDTMILDTTYEDRTG